MSKIIGRCIGETSLTEVNFISKEMPQVGEYVSLEYDKKNVLGMIEALFRGSVSINDEIYDPKTIEKIREIEGDDHYIRGKVKILGDINDNLRIPRTPAPPGTEIKKTNPKYLKEIFEFDKGLKLGNLISQQDVEVMVDINRMVSRHLAILAMTGAGKSNTVAVVVNGLLKHNGCIVIFDMHSEYSDIKFKNGNLNLIKPQINPLYMSYYEMKDLARIPNNAYIQERYFREAFNNTYNKAKKAGITGKKFINDIKIQLEGWIKTENFRGNQIKPNHINSVIDVVNKIEDLEKRYGHILDLGSGDLLSKLKINSANVIDLGSMDESAAGVVVSHILRNSLDRRKKFLRGKLDKYDKLLKYPVFFILEEAHILAPQNREPSSKKWIRRIAREGRKFSLGLCLVSQSPKSVDSDSLSQANNMIILRLVEPKDQKHVQTASESLSDDFVSQLPSLNIGEAVVLGMMTKIPTIVKVHECEEKPSGGDLDIVGEWDLHIKKETRAENEEDEDLMDQEEPY